jgi:hypothetical protein
MAVPLAARWLLTAVFFMAGPGRVASAGGGKAACPAGGPRSA